MQIASVGQSAAAHRTPEAAERGPDRDGDKDDRGVTAKSSLSANVGKTVDVTA